MKLCCIYFRGKMSKVTTFRIHQSQFVHLGYNGIASSLTKTQCGIWLDKTYISFEAWCIGCWFYRQQLMASPGCKRPGAHSQGS